MISLETAKKLRDAGLEWKPQEGDYIRYFDGNLISILTCGDVAFEDLKDCIFAPRLDQLLSEIEKRGYWWEIGHRIVDVGKIHKYKIWVSKKHQNNANRSLMSDSPEEAAAQALLWILKEGC